MDLRGLIYKKPIPIILGGFVNGLGLIRSFGYAKIPTICLDSKKSISYYSKYTIPLICPNPENEESAFIEFLIDLGKKLPEKGVLYATNDIWLVPISRNQNKLAEYYIYPMSNWNVIEKCWNKKYLYQISADCDIPVPKTFFLSDIAEIDTILDDINLPCVIKPVETIGFLEKIGSKGRTIIINDISDLKFWKKRFILAKIEKIGLIVQERIRGPPTNLFTITSYSDKYSNITAYSIGHKIRQFPPDAGTITSGKVENETEVYNLGYKLIKALKFHGISNIEFKKDDENGLFKLIEINPRPGMWNYSAFISGVNLPYISYQDALGIKEDIIIPTPTYGKIWIMLSSDLLNSLILFKLNGYSEHSITLRDWLSSIKGEKVYAIESFDDPFPGLFHWGNILMGYASSLVKHLMKKL